jgi:mxaA protein
MSPSAPAQVQSVTLLPPARDFGYFIGDTMSLEAFVATAPDTALDPHSLPVPGPVGPGVDVRQVAVVAERAGVWVRVEYQTFVAPEEAMQVRVPGYSLTFRRGDARFVAQVPFWNFYTSPFRHERQAVVDPAALRADHAVAGRSLRHAWIGLGASLAVAGAAGFALAKGRGWVPRLARRRAPFARAARSVTAVAGRDDGGAWHADALVALHRAFDEASGRRMMAEDVAAFVAARAAFQPLREEIEWFFTASRAVFFGADAAAAAHLASAARVVALARRLRQVERMA